MPGVTARIGGLIRWTIETAQRFKVNLTPNHYYSEFPDIRTLRRETYWRKPWSMVGVQGADAQAEGGPQGVLDRQLAFVRGCCQGCRTELEGGQIHQQACDRNGEGGFGPIEAEFLHCFVRARRPAKVIQIGCGVSTAVIQAAAQAAGHKIEIVCIEPFPTEFLQKEQAEGRLRLVREMAQKVPAQDLAALEPGDLLFIDSSHTVRLGAEVPWLFLEVLPRLRPGVHVHVHDVHFPYDYPPGVLDKELFFNREATLLHAFLAMNPAFRINAALTMLHHGATDQMREIFPTYRPARLENAVIVEPGHSPSSIYIERV